MSTLLLSDVDSRSERALCPEAFEGFRSGSPRHVIVDRQGIVRGTSVPRHALQQQLAAIVDETARRP